MACFNSSLKHLCGFISQCLQELVANAQFLQTTELENTVTACFRALEGSNYDVRSSVAKLLAILLSTTQTNPPQGNLRTFM